MSAGPAARIAGNERALKSNMRKRCTKFARKKAWLEMKNVENDGDVINHPSSSSVSSVYAGRRTSSSVKLCPDTFMFH